MSKTNSEFKEHFTDWEQNPYQRHPKMKLFKIIKKQQEILKIEDFPDLKESFLKQKIKKVNNKDERIKIWQNLVKLDLEGDPSFKKMEGIEYLGKAYNIDCVKYVLGNFKLKDTIQGVLEHSGNPSKEDLIIYGHSINHPTHIGVYQNDGKIISKWGDNGPIIKHDIDKIIWNYGNYFFFSNFKPQIYQNLS